MQFPREEFQSKQKEIQVRLKQFQLLNENQIYQEFLFCLLTPQSKAQKCWEAVESLSALRENEWTIENISNILKSKTRFHHTKALRVFNAPKIFKQIKPLLQDSSLSVIDLRNKISEIVNGYGLKESSHFLRNIGLSQNQIAILDRHIIKNLKLNNLMKEDKITSNKHYLQIESTYLNHSKNLNIPADELDLFFWQKENGEIFK